MRKTNPIWPGRRVNAQNEPNLARPGGRCEVSSVKSGRSGIQLSDFRLHTSNLKLRAQRPDGRGCVRNEANSGVKRPQCIAHSPPDGSRTSERGIGRKPVAG
jgi:hypothetical protein